MLTFLIGGVSLSFEIPKLEQLSTTVYVYKGGVSIIPELISLALALSMYTATFIAENVRAGILGVNKGQKEAAASIGLTKGQILKLVVMPQALRIIIPPTTNQYLNLNKKFFLSSSYSLPRYSVSICRNCFNANWKGNRNYFNYNVYVFIFKLIHFDIYELV